MNLSVITATYRRRALLSFCLQQFRAQSTGGLEMEHIVVSDGPDPFARYQSESAGAVYHELDRNHGRWGVFARDAGLALARGKYVCFWDDDNRYEPHAAVALYSAAAGYDIGVVRASRLKRGSPGRHILPPAWDGEFKRGEIDTMNFCVRRELAQTERWADDDPGSGTDFRWISRLSARGATIRYVPVVIGEHL